jgi:hypothetical protein
MRAGLIAVLALASLAVASRAEAQAGYTNTHRKIIAMYVHQHWPYNHPYCARTWTIEDWRGYAGGLKQLGYNTIMIWPMLDIMPDPPSPSDLANLRKIARVIDMLHHEMDMRVYIALCPNIISNSEEARKSTFEKRHYFACEQLVNPADPEAMKRMLDRRRRLLEPLKQVDGISIIDSDPGGYPGSTIAEYVNLLGEHRKMLDTLRPGIELVYWMHAGWRGWSRLYESAQFKLGTPDEYEETVERLVKLNPEPWSMANGLEYAQKNGIADRVLSFNYGRIEGEPSFPMTNFTPENAYEGGSLPGPRGVMGNAQTHCCQLPNTFAFVRGALGKPVTDKDFVAFANRLIPGYGKRIVRAWKAMAGDDPKEMYAAADEIQATEALNPQPGPLKGLLFGSPKRFLNDMCRMLRLRASGEEFRRASDAGQDVRKPFEAYAGHYSAWQATHGFSGAQDLGRPAEALRRLHNPAIDACFADFKYDLDPLPGHPNTPLERVRAGFIHMESFSSRMGAAMRSALKEMR